MKFIPQGNHNFHTHTAKRCRTVINITPQGNYKRNEN